MKVLALIVVVLLIVAGAFWYEKRRSDDLALVAKHLGFSFEPGQQALPRDLAEADFYLFSQGPSLLRNLMRGDYQGRPVQVFGYAFSAGFGDEGMRELPNSDNDGVIETRMQTVVWMRTGRRLPEFDLAPTGGPIRSVGTRFGFTAVGFDERKAFHSVYTLTGRNPAEIRRYFNSAALDYLTIHTGITVESRGHEVLLYRQEQRLSGSEIPSFLDSAEVLLAHLQQPE